MRTLREIWRFATSSKSTPDIPKRAYKKHGETLYATRKYTKITEEHVKQIRLLSKKGVNQSNIAKQVKVAPSTVSKIMNRQPPYKAKYTVGDMPSNPKAVYQRHQNRIATGNMEYIPNHHLCPVCNPNSTTTWREYFTMTHRATIKNARKNNKGSSDFSLSNY